MRCVDLKRAMVWLFAISLLGLVLSCTNELDEMYGNSLLLSEEMESTSPYHIPLNDALDNLEKTMDVMGMTTTRARYDRAKWKIERIPMSRFRPETRATDEGVSDAIYVVNFDNNEGYAIVSADTRLPDDVIAVTSSGNVEFNSTLTENPLDSLNLGDLYVAEDDDYLFGMVSNNGMIEGLVSSYVIDWINSPLEGTPGGNELPEPQLPGEENDNGGFGDVDIYITSYVFEDAELCSAKLQTRWKQGEPVNTYCDKRYYYRALGMEWSRVDRYDLDTYLEWGSRFIRKEDLFAGCVSIAVSQIIAYNKYPPLMDFVEGESMTWNELCDGTDVEDMSELQIHNLASLVHSVGVGCNMQYGFLGTDQSFATPIAARRFLESLGYLNVVRTKNYDYTVIKRQLDLGYPVLVAAVANRVDGHAWVVDGYRKINKKRIVQNVLGEIVSQTVESNTKYVHCNWGWEGDCDGWFVSGLFDVVDAYEYDSETRSNDSSLNFDHLFRMVTYEIPK